MRTIDADEVAVRATVALLADVTPADLDRATPCTAWNLRALLIHMTVQHHGFAAAAQGNGANPAVWLPPPTIGLNSDSTAPPNSLLPTASLPPAAPPGPDSPPLAAPLLAAYAEAAELVIAAFAGAVDEFELPEIATGRPVPQDVAIGFHLVDYVVHGWDVARSLGVPFALPDEVIAAALPIAVAVPGGERRLVPGAAFGPELAVGAGTKPLDEILARLGRDPQWAPAK